VNSEPKVIIVLLRQPRLNEPDEMRRDPYWEFGSFGCTRCHRRNLMNPQKIHLLNDARFAFAQGGAQGFKLVHLTPPVEMISHGHFAEAKWSPIHMPFKYECAPLLINNQDESGFPLLSHVFSSVRRPSPVARFASKFRSRRESLSQEVAQEIIQIFDHQAIASEPDAFAKTYVDALPYHPPKIDEDREQSYQALLSQPYKRGRRCKSPC
jgi:hypothetical protein